MSYIIIMDGELFKSEEITDDDKEGCETDAIEIIDTSTMKNYFNDGWHDLQVWGG